MAKKIKIDVDFTEDNQLIGISCHKKDYWFAYHLNNNLRIDLKRLGDFPFYQVKREEFLNYSLFHYQHQDDRTGYFLISNHNKEYPLFPELKTTDFFMLLQGRVSGNYLNNVLNGIRNINGVLTAFLPEIKKLKEYDNFLSDLEIHMSTVQK